MVVVVVGGGRESDYRVCPRPLLQFMSDRLCQVTPGYTGLHQVTSVYVEGTGRGARQHSLSLDKLEINTSITRKCRR